MSKTINSEDIFDYILSLIRFPFAQKCRHAVALDLLDIMERNGIDLPENLVQEISASSAGDFNAETILLTRKIK